MLERLVVRWRRACVSALHPPTLAALLLMGVNAAVRLSVVLPSYFWQDDFAHLATARDLGLSPELLVRDYNDHLEPFPNFVYWWLSQFTGRSFLVPGLLISLLHVIAALLFWRLLVAIVGNRPIVLVPLVGYMFTPLSLVTTTWLASALEALPLQIALFSGFLGAIRYAETRRPLWLVLSCLALVGGLLSWEKAVVILPATVGVMLLVVWSGLPWHERRVRLERMWPLWLAQAVIVASYLVLYFSVVDGSERVEVDSAPYFESAVTVLAQVLVPGLLGGPWHVSGAENTLYPESPWVLVTLCGLAILTLVVVSTRVSGARALEPWALAAAYVVGAVLLMLWGRANYLDLVNRDPRYLADAVPVVLLCALVAFQSPLATATPTEGDGGVAALQRPRVAYLVSMGLFASSMLTTVMLTPKVQHDYPREFVDGMVAQFELTPGLTVVDTDAPPGVTWLTQDNLLRALGYVAPFDQSSTDMRMFDSLAQPREVILEDVILDERGPEPECGWPVAQSRVRLELLPSSEARVTVLRLGYITGESARLFMEVDGLTEALDLEPGIGHAYFVVTGRSGPIEAWTRQTTSGVCLSDVSAGRPWPRP